LLHSRQHRAAGLAGGLRRLIAEETDKWAKVVKFANIKPE